MTESKVLTTDDKYLELALSCQGFMVEAKKVDTMFVFESVDPKNAEGRVKSPAQLPINYTDLTATIKVSENANLRSQNPREGKSGGGLMKMAWKIKQCILCLLSRVMLTQMI